MFKADVFCPILALMFLVACAGGGGTAHLPTAPPDDEVSEIDCDRPHGSDNVYVTAEQFAKRLGASAKKFSEVRSTLARPAEVCGVSQELDLLTRLRCNDGSNPYRDRRAAHRSRRGSTAPAGRCGSPIDAYEVPCPEAFYRVHIDIHICPERDMQADAAARSKKTGTSRDSVSLTTLPKGGKAR